MLFSPLVCRQAAVIQESRKTCSRMLRKLIYEVDLQTYESSSESTHSVLFIGTIVILSNQNQLIRSNT